MYISLIYAIVAFQGIKDKKQENRDLKVKIGKDLKWIWQPKAIHAHVEHLHGHVQKHAQRHGRVRYWNKELKEDTAVSRSRVSEDQSTRARDTPVW